MSYENLDNGGWMGLLSDEDELTQRLARSASGVLRAVRVVVHNCHSGGISETWGTMFFEPGMKSISFKPDTGTTSWFAPHTIGTGAMSYYTDHCLPPDFPLNGHGIVEL